MTAATPRIRHSELRKLARLARRQGWTVTYTGGDHLKWVPPKGEFIITAGTPDSQQSFTNNKKDLERAGLITNAAELKRIEKARKPPNPDPPGEAMPPLNGGDDMPFLCPYPGCRERFISQFLRDRHMEDHRPQRRQSKHRRVLCPAEGCEKPNQGTNNIARHVERNHPEIVYMGTKNGEVLWEPAAVREVEREPSPEPRETAGHSVPTGDIGGQAHPHQKSTRNEQDDVNDLVDLLVEAVFPDGVPFHNVEVMQELAAFIDDTQTKVARLRALAKGRTSG